MSDRATGPDDRVYRLHRRSTPEDRAEIIRDYIRYDRIGLVCPECSDVMHPVVGQDPRTRVWHFAHNGGTAGGCPLARGESDLHRKLKDLIWAAAIDAGAKADREQATPDRRRIPDVAVVVGDASYAWEVQLSAEGYAEHVERDRAVRSWVAGLVWVSAWDRPADGHPWVTLSLDGLITSGCTTRDGTPGFVQLVDFMRALHEHRATETERAWIVPVDIIQAIPRRGGAELAMGYDRQLIDGKWRTIRVFQPPFPDRWVGEELQRRIEAFRGGVRTELMACSVCGGMMIPCSLGGHARCLGVESVQEPMPGPRLIGDFLQSAVAELGRQTAINDSAAAKAAAAALEAMPVQPAGPEPELPAALFEPDLDTQRRIAKALSGAPKCRICRKPMHTGAYAWSGDRDGDLGGDPRPAHFICAEAEARGVEIDEVYALQPHGRVKGRKSRDLANVIWATTVDETERHWTDWAAAVATPDEGAAT